MSLFKSKFLGLEATSRILGRKTASAGSAEELTAAEVRTILNVADGATANPNSFNRTSNFTTTSSSYVDVTNISSSAMANKKYLVTGWVHLAITGGGIESCILAIPSGYISGSYQDGSGNQVSDFRNSTMTAIIHSSSSSVGYLFRYFIEVGATGGAIKLQIKTSDGTSTAYAGAGTYMVVQEVS